MNADDSDGAAPPPRPREWFAVLFGSRLLRGNFHYVNKLTDAVTRLATREGMLLQRRPFFRDVIYEEDHERLDDILRRIGDGIDSIRRLHRIVHMPFIIAIDDQTLHEFYSDCLLPRFGDSSFIYAHKATTVQEMEALDSWEELAGDIREIKDVMDEHNPLEPQPIDYPESRGRSDTPAEPSRSYYSREGRGEEYGSRDRDYGNQARGGEDYEAPRRSSNDRSGYDRGEGYRNQDRGEDYDSRGRGEDYGSQRRDDDRYPDGGRRNEQNRMPSSKLTFSADVVAGALESIEHNRDLLYSLAEDMNRNVDISELRLPREPLDLLNLLKLFVHATDNYPADLVGQEKDAATKLRKQITEQMLHSGLIDAVRTCFLQGIHERIERKELDEKDLDQVAESIRLLLISFYQLAKHNILNEEAFRIWSLIEKPVFSLPASFWHHVGLDTLDQLSKRAAAITNQEPSIYTDSVQSIIEADRQARATRQEVSRDRAPSRGAGGYSNQNRRDDREEYRSQQQRDYGRQQETAKSNGHAGSADRTVSRYKHDPYEMDSDDDESDTTEVYDNSEGYSSRSRMAEYGSSSAGGGGGRQEEEYRGQQQQQDRYRDQQDGFNDEYDGGYDREEYDSRQQRRDEEEEEHRRKLAEEREAQQLREMEAERERDREFNERRHTLAMQQMERRGRGEERNMFAYDANEMTAPPCSYRKLANRPVYEDLFQPKVPYIRRALVDGMYTDNEHYLDVQFRLLREDMVSPLRDGIYSLKQMCGEGRQLVSNNDTKIYPKVTVGALQVKGLDGIRMRVVTLPNNVLCTIRDDRQLKFGQCVCLSSDNFEREFHIGWVADRYQDEGQPWNGRLGISFFDEEDGVRRGGMTPISKDKVYDMAEPSSYFEAYRHVLNVLRKMKRYTPFPLERYMVHLKRNPRLPLYMRVKEKEEDQTEDRELQILYAKRCSEDQKKEEEKKKKKATRSSRSASTTNGEEEAVEYVTTEEGADAVSSHSDVDDGFNTDEEDAFLTGRGRVMAHPNPTDLRTIQIGERAYNVETLEQDFESDTLDDTQKAAMCYALKSELAIIQGPPGTGKTHIGVEIVMAILANRSKWRMTEPILIVTFSNQALDHFLEKIGRKLERFDHPDAPKILRLGSRSESEEIKRSYLFSEVVRDIEEDLASPNNFEKKKKERDKKRRAVGKLLNAVRIVRASRTEVMNFIALTPAIDPTHQMQLRQMGACKVDSNGVPLNLDETLACWLLDKDYAKKRDLPSGDDSDVDDFGARKERKKPTPKAKKAGKESEPKKEQNERKRLEKRQRWKDDEDSSDTEEESTEEAEASSAADAIKAKQEMEEDETNDDDDAILRALLAKMNMEAERQKRSAESEEKWRKAAEKYEVDEEWEEEKKLRKQGGGVTESVEIFTKTQKDGLRVGKKQPLVAIDPNIVKDINEQKHYILAKEALTTVEVREVRDIRSLPKERRWRLLVHWQDNLAKAKRDSLDDLCDKYNQACTRFMEAQDDSYADVARKALIIGATTTGSAKRRRMISKIGPKVLIVEEAAEVLEAHLLASIVPSVQHAIFIGDHQQLRPGTAVHHLAKNANLEISLFERLVKNNYPFHTLGHQHRMLLPLTKHVVRPYFYKMLQDAPSVAEYPDVKGMATNLFFWAHNVPEDTVMDSMSKRNSTEAGMCMNLANYIILQGQYKASEITIIGMYGAQVIEIKRQLANAGGAVRDVAVETVDSFQGKENRIMILSLVRSCSGSVGFLAIANRITVGLTRAQHGMYVIGNFCDIAQYSDLWNNIVNSLNDANLIDYSLPVVCQRHGHETGIKINKDFPDLTPRGGCTDMCRYEMPCGHRCKAQCHPPYHHEIGLSSDPNDPQQVFVCEERCTKKCDKCGAQCKRKCSQDCGTCHEVVTIELSCGHTVRCECGARALARCKEPCAEVLGCGHHCQNKCSVGCVTMEKCEQGTSYTHPFCSHRLVLPCNRVNNMLNPVLPPPCYEPCPERLVCGHKCPRKCGEPCPTMCEVTVSFTGECGHKVEKKCSEDKNHVQCMRLTPSEMPHCDHVTQIECYKRKDQTECRSTCKQATSCGHRCTLSCGACYKKLRAHECDAKCLKQLPCGHQCQAQCLRPCKCLTSCRTRCSHQRCGSIISGTKGGTMTYSRDCSDPCVLCVESCENHCEHRRCGKKCYAACDVPPCNRSCSKLLRCSHRCLGLCGETCPQLCGTCDIAQYKKLLEDYKMPSIDDETGEPTLLIQLPECKHVLPYKRMDEEVKRQIEKGDIVLRCPNCNKMIDESRRYLRQQKRLWLETDSRKWEKRMTDENMSRAELINNYRRMRNQVATQHEDMVKIQKAVGKREENALAKFSSEVFRMADKLTTEIRVEMDGMNERSEYYYWESVVSCHKSICALVIDYVTFGDRFGMIPVGIDQPNLQAVTDDAFDRRRVRIHMMRAQWQELINVMQNSMEDRRVGALMPAFLDALVRCTLHFHMERLATAMRATSDNGERVDLARDTMFMLRRVIKSIKEDNPDKQPARHLVNMIDRINTDVYTKQLGLGGLIPAFRVEPPTF